MSPGRRRALTAGAVLLLLAAVAGGYALRAVTVPLLLALAAAYMLDPLVAVLAGRGLPRRLAVCCVLAAFGAAAAAGLFVLVDQAVGLYHSAFHPQDGFVLRLGERLERLLGEALPGKEAVAAWIRDHLTPERAEALFAPAASVLGALGGWLSSLLGLLSLAVLLPIYLFYFLLALPELRRAVKDHLPGRYRERILRVAGRLHEELSLFFRGLLVVVVVKGLLLAAGLWIGGIRFPLLLGFSWGLLSVVPFVGSLAGFLLTALLTVADTGSLHAVLVVAAVFVAAEAVETLALQPLIMGRKLGLHPLVVLVSFLVWAVVFGFFGALIAIPLTLAVRVLFRELALPPLRELAAEGRAPPAAGP